MFEFLISLIDRLRRLLEGEVNQKNLLPITNESPHQILHFSNRKKFAKNRKNSIGQFWMDRVVFREFFSNSTFGTLRYRKWFNSR